MIAKTTTAALLLTLVGLPATALAGPGHHRGHHDGYRAPTHQTAGYGRHARPAGIQVRNPTDAFVDVVVDGRVIGQLAPGGVDTFSTRPGRSTITLMAHGARHGPTPVLTQAAYLGSGQITAMRVPMLEGRLVMFNDGHTPIYVTVTPLRGRAARRHGTEGVWILPGDRTAIDAPATQVSVTTHVQTRRGLVALDTQVADVVFGQRTRTRLGAGPRYAAYGQGHPGGHAYGHDRYDDHRGRGRSSGMGNGRQQGHEGGNGRGRGRG